MVLVAGFLVVRLGLFFKNGAESASFSLKNSQQVLAEQDVNIFLVDSDNDGIPDLSEAYYRTSPFNPDTDGDGYLDGEEVASGFDPTKKDDKKRTAKKNVTETFTERLVAGLYVGDLKPENENFNENLDLLTFAVIDDSIQKLYPPINKDGIKLTDNSVSSQEEYLENISLLIEGPFLAEFMSQSQIMHKAVMLLLQNNYEEATKIFNNLSITFAGAYTKLLTVPVPPKWESFHLHMLTIFRNISINHASLAKINEDPFLALTALSSFTSNLSEIEFSLIQELRILIKNNDLKVPDSVLFEVLGFLNN